MARITEKIILGILIVAVISISSFVIVGFSGNKALEPSSNIQQTSLEQAKTTALGAADGTITEAFLTVENGVSVYEIEIANGNLETEIKIDPINGNILSIETDEEEVITVEELERIQDKISTERAKEIALGEVSGRVVNVGTEKENGRILYEVEIDDGNDIVEVEIDGETGEVLEVEREDDDEDEE